MPLFRDSIDRHITGDIAPTLPSTVQLESAVASPLLLESRGSNIEGLFAPTVHFDEVRTIEQNTYARFSTPVYSVLEGTLDISQPVLNNGSDITSVVQPTNAPHAETIESGVDPALAAALEEGLRNGTLVATGPLDDPNTQIIAAPLPTQETAPPPPPPAANDAGAPEAPPTQNTTTQSDVQDAPAGGCETVTDVRVDELGNVFNVVLHFNGAGFDEIA